MAVVSIHAPRTQHALHVTIVSGPPHVVHHLVASPFDDGSTNFGGKGIQHFIPANALPLALAALTRALQGIQNALWIVDLVDGGRAFGAVAPTTARMIGVALQLLDAARLFIDIGQQPAGRLAVEADSGDNFVMPLHFARPRLRVVFYPVVPALRRRTRGQIAHGHRLARGGNMLFQGNLAHLLFLF